MNLDDKGNSERKAVTHQGYLSCVQIDFLSDFRIEYSDLELTVSKQFYERRVEIFGGIQSILVHNPFKNIYKLTSLVVSGSIPVVRKEVSEGVKQLPPKLSVFDLEPNCPECRK